MKGIDEQYPNSTEAFAVPASTSTPRFFLWEILVLASVPLLDLVVRLLQVAHLDQSILDALVVMRTPALTQVMLAVTNVFMPVVTVSRTIALGGMIYVFSGSWCERLIVSAVMVCSLVITTLIKGFIENICPVFPRRLVVKGSYSSPSGHATAVVAACITGVLLVLHRLTNRIPSNENESFPRLPTWIIKGSVIADAIALIVLIAFTRLYLGTYWFSDVIAGALVGITSSLIVTELLSNGT